MRGLATNLSRLRYLDSGWDEQIIFFCCKKRHEKDHGQSRVDSDAGGRMAGWTDSQYMAEQPNSQKVIVQIHRRTLLISYGHPACARHILAQARPLWAAQSHTTKSVFIKVHWRMQIWWHFWSLAPGLRLWLHSLKTQVPQTEERRLGEHLASLVIHKFLAAIWKEPGLSVHHSCAWGTSGGFAIWVC